MQQRVAARDRVTVTPCRVVYFVRDNTVTRATNIIEKKKKKKEINKRAINSALLMFVDRPRNMGVVEYLFH